MANLDSAINAQLPLLDRLIDHEPEVTVEPPMSRAAALKSLKEALRRDLEWLLNTRRTPWEFPKSHVELAASVFNYGLTDLTSVSLNSPQDEAQLLRSIEATVALFEPRLAKIKVSAREPLRQPERVLHFQIDAMLLVDPAPEAITFDTILNVDRGECKVKG